MMMMMMMVIGKQWYLGLHHLTSFSLSLTFDGRASYNRRFAEPLLTTE